MEIIRLYKWRFLIGVIFPSFLAGLAVPFCSDFISQIVTGIVGCITSYLTWISILDLHKSNRQNVLAHELRTNIEGARNGNKHYYNSLINMDRAQLSSLEDMVLQESIIGIQNNWRRNILEKNTECLTEIESGKLITYPIEIEFFKLRFTNVWGNTIQRRHIIINDIVRQKHKYLIKELYNITQNENDIFFAIRAAKAICQLTNFSPYLPKTGYSHNTEDSFFYDIPEFKKMKVWWEEEGSLTEEFNCPFDQLINNSRNLNYFDRAEDNDERITNLYQIVEKYPLLSRTKAELAYLLLNGNQNIEKIVKLCNDSIALHDNELLPYLILTLVDLNSGNQTYIEKYLSKLKEFNENKILVEYIVLNEKFKPYSTILRNLCE